MRDQEDGHAQLLLEGVDEADDLVLDGHVEGRGGLVGQEELGSWCQGDGYHHALTHAAGELVDVVAQALLGLGDVDHAQKLDRAVVHALLVQSLSLQRLKELLSHRGHGVERGHGVLEDHADLLAANLAQLPLAHLGHVAALVENLAAHDLARLGQQADDGAGGGGLAATGLPHQAKGLAHSNGEGHALHGAHGLGFGLVVHAEVCDLEQWLWHRPSS